MLSRQPQIIKYLVYQFGSNYYLLLMEVSVCGLCQLQVPANNTLPTQLPLYTPQYDSLKLTLKKLCKACQLLITQIELFANHHQIKYCDSHFKSSAVQGMKSIIPQPKTSLQLLYTSMPGNNAQRTRADSDNKNKLIAKRLSCGERNTLQGQHDELTHPYINLVLEEIKGKSLFCLSYLPKTLQLLIHLSTQPATKQAIVSAEERREKLKNIVLFLTQRVHLTLQQLPYAIVLANFLLCMMDPGKATAVIVRLSDIMMYYPDTVNWKTLILDPDMHQSKNPQSPASLEMRSVVLKVDKLWMRIQAVLQLSRRGEAVLHEGTIRIGKITSQLYKQSRKRLTQVLKPLLLKRQERQQRSDQRLTLLYHMKLQRNSFSLIIKNMLGYEQDVKQEIMTLSLRYKKEKEEYIQKIVRLNNKIEELQHKITEVDGRNMSIDQLIEQVPQILPQKDTKDRENVLKPNQIEDQPSNSQDVLLQSVLTLSNLVGFNQKHIDSHPHSNFHINSAQSLMKLIVGEIQKLQQAYQKISVKLRHAQEEKKGLLGIVTRKDDRYLSVITEKDIVIERYEQALWRMQNGLDVEEEPLAHRIRYIKHIFSKKHREVELIQQQDPREAKQKKQCDIY